MMYDAVIYLVSKVDTGEKDQYGDTLYIDSASPVFAEEKSVGMKEFYQANTNGLKPEIVFELEDYYDYNGQNEIIHEEVRYKILRTYRKGKKLEITCYGGVRNEHTEISHENQ